MAAWCDEVHKLRAWFGVTIVPAGQFDALAAALDEADPAPALARAHRYWSEVKADKAAIDRANAHDIAEGS